MKYLAFSILLFLSSIALLAEPSRDSEHAKKAFDIFEKVISIPTVKGRGKVPEMATYLSSELIAAGFSKEDISIVESGETASLIVHYKGDGSSGKKPILLLAHMDVVEALTKDWERPPFKLTKDDKNFYGRGTIDNKFGVTMLTSTFIRLKKEGFIPSRDLYIAFSGDEETAMVTTRYLANQRPDLAEAEFALNSDAGGGNLTKEGKAVGYSVQAAEKMFASFELTARNPGGHSSRPRPDNAIYELMDGLKAIQNYKFPVKSSVMTRNYLRIKGEQLGGEVGEAMVRFANNPKDQTASDRLSIEGSVVGFTRTTCVTTMLTAGHASNALPQSATATVNCRVFPGVGADKVKLTLVELVNDKDIEVKLLGKPTESPISELRDDILGAVGKAVLSRYPNVKILGEMAAYGTDGMHFRSAGIPTYGVASLFMEADEMFSHGLNERIPIKAFYDGLEHWSIILRDLAGQ